jgi:hypothetical protein
MQSLMLKKAIETISFDSNRITYDGMNREKAVNGAMEQMCAQLEMPF